MNLHITIPYSLEKNLGKAYNEAMSAIPDDDWMCFIDYDVMLLTPDAISIIHNYIQLFPQAGLLTCFTNRIHSSSKQLLKGEIDDNDSMTWHLRQAAKQKDHLYQVTKLYKNISGFLMCISKNTWRQIPFIDNGECLGVDTDYWRKLRDAGRPMYRMDGLYVFHTYRLLNGVQDKAHLQP